MTNTGWAFVLLASFFVVFVLWLAAEPLRQHPARHRRREARVQDRLLGRDDVQRRHGHRPDVLRRGRAARPLREPAAGHRRRRQTPQAVQTAMATTLFHWTLHPWAIYAVVGIAIAYGTFRKGRSQLISRGVQAAARRKRTEGPIGKLIDILAIFATLFGSAASLGLGALQIGSGLKFNGWFGEVGTPVLVAIIAILTVAFVASAVSGVAKGIQWLSNINMVLAIALALFVFVARPDGPHPQPDARPRSATTSATWPRWPRAPRPAAATRWRRGSPAGRSSTGPGGSRGRRSSACSSPASAAAAPSGSSSPACCWCRAWSAWSGSRSSVARPSTPSASPHHRQTADDLVPRSTGWPRSTSTACCSSCSTSTRSPA